MKNNNSEWVKYEASGNGYIFPKDWGIDHWSTFAYAASCVTGRKGLIENARMRTNSRIHREMVHMAPFNTMNEGGGYPTRLKLGIVDNHDDWSCLEDAVAAGLLNIFYTKISDKLFGCCEARIELTDAGWEVVKTITEHKNAGGNFKEFNL